MTTIGILTRNPNSWCTRELIRACLSEGCKYLTFSFRDLVAVVGRGRVEIWLRNVDKLDRLVDIVLVRPIGKCSLEQAIFRMDLLHCMRDVGLPVVNDPRAIEIAIDKFRTLYLLTLSGLPTPLTVVCESEYRVAEQLSVFNGGDIVVKPLFGSRGFGVFRLRSRCISEMRDLVWRVCFYLTASRAVLLLQEYLRHGGVDYRLLVVGGRVIAYMMRRARSTWKTNISQGGEPVKPPRLDPEIEDLAVKSCKVIGCDIAGVDIVETRSGEKFIIELNTQPGWRGIQSVSDVDIAREIVKFLIEKAKR